MNEKNTSLLNAYIRKLKSEINNEEYFAEMLFEFHYELKEIEDTVLE